MTRLLRASFAPIATATLIAACSHAEAPSGSSASSGTGGAASTAGTGGGQGGDPSGGQGGQAGQGGQTGPGGDADAGGPPPTLEDAGGFHASDDWIFADQTIHTVEITLPADSIAGLGAAPFTYVPGDFVFDGIALPKVGVRLRGKIGSFRTLAGKPKFKIDFGQIVPDQRFFGLQAMTLNNEVVDCSYLKEPLAYRVFALAGVPSERTSFAKVTVNGADYGFYVLVETPDARWLKRNYSKSKGNFYDGKYIWFGGNNYTLLDFGLGAAIDDQFQLEEGTDIGHADIYGLSNAVAASLGTGQFVAGLEPVLNWAEYHRELAAEQWVGHNDGYALNTNNYRVYFDPADGKAQIIPWDFDYGFLHASDWGMSWASPKGRIAQGCFSDAQCAADHKVAVQALLNAIDPAALLAWFNQLDALTFAATQGDPRRECAADQVAPWRDGLRAWINGGNAQLAASWGL